ncbi:Exocyst complex component SEC5 [[Candida] zeylanoides]
MLDFDASEESVCAFYGLESPFPDKLSDVWRGGTPLGVEEVAGLSLDEQFDALLRLGTPEAEAGDAGYEDPLGLPRAVESLVARGAVSDRHDARLAALSVRSPSFSPHTYLSVVHHESSMAELVRALRYLEKNIEGSTSELRRAIDANYVEFAVCKRAIDSVLEEFKRTRTLAQQQRASAKVYTPGRAAAAGDSLVADLDAGLKNLLTTTSLMIKPIVDRKSRQDKLARLIEFVQSHRELVDLPSRLVACLREQQHDRFVELYHEYRRRREAMPPADEPLYNTVLVRTFKEVDAIVEEYRKKTYQELLSTDHEADGGARGARNTSRARFATLLDKLYELAPQRSAAAPNPIREFLVLQVDGLQSEFTYQYRKFESKFAAMQRKLVAYLNSLSSFREGGSNVSYIGAKYTAVEEHVANDVGAAGAAGGASDAAILEVFDASDSLDVSIISETWLVLHNFVVYLDEMFVDKMAKFVRNYAHYHGGGASAPVDADGAVRDQFVKLMVTVATRLVAVFDDRSKSSSTTRDLVESTPQLYDSFVPHHSNSLSAIHYLTHIQRRLNSVLTRVGKAVNAVSRSNDTNAIIKSLRNSSTVINQRIVEAVCAVWVNDCSQFYDLETWEVQPAGDGGSCTRTVGTMECYEKFVLTKVAQLVSMKETDDDAIPGEPVRIVAAHPSKRVFVSIEIQFVRSLNVLVNSILKSYAIEKAKSEHGIYKVLARNNFDVLARHTFPALIAKFDRVFQNNLSQQNMRIYADIDKASLTILDDVLARERKLIDDIVVKHFTHTIYLTGRAGVAAVDAFVYDTLVHFVTLVHTIKPLTGADTFVTILNELQTYFLNVVLENMRAVPHDQHYMPMVANLRLSLNFYLEVFAQSPTLQLNQHCVKLIDILFNEIDDAGEPPYTEHEFDAILAANLKESAVEFNSFY